MEESIYFQAKDLMLGDWIKIGKVPLRVIQLTHFTHKDDSVVLETGSEYLDVEPIPITPEILEKNGWKYESTIKAYERKDGAYYISIDIEGKTRIYVCNDYIFGMALGYVHELQHALRLVGLSELADNFKV